MNNTLKIAWIAVQELVYEKVFYLLLSFTVLALSLSLIFSQLTYAEQAKLTLDFLLAGAEISMILFSVFMGISLFQKELTLGSVSMVLSKPIHRAQFLVGKFLGQLVVQTLVMAAMTAITLFICRTYFDTLSANAIVQTMTLILGEVLIVTAVTYFFAVNAGVVTTAVVTLFIFALGHLRDPISKNLEQRGEVHWPWVVCRSVIPDLEIFNTKELASYGISVPWHDVGLAWSYVVCCLVFYLVIAAICFNQKDILT